MKEIVLATDLGGTNLRMAAVDREGNILHQTKRETPRTERADEIVRAIAISADECRAKVKEQGEIIAITAAVPSGVDYLNGIIVKAPNLPCLDGFRMAAALENELSLKVVLENDANAAAVGENWIGASKDVQDSIMLMIGCRQRSHH
jgi:glucokinase